MISPQIYQLSESLAKANLPSWRLSQVHNPSHFKKVEFPVQVDKLWELGQLLDTMQENRFSAYMAEMGGLTDQEFNLLLTACYQVIALQVNYLNKIPIIPLSTLISSLSLYRNLLSLNPELQSILEIGPGCGYLSYFLRNHHNLQDYSQTESSQSFYLLQSLINDQCFTYKHVEYANIVNESNIFFKAMPECTEYSPVLNNIIKPKCFHYPWWKLGSIIEKKYQIVTSNANLLEFSSYAFSDYIDIIECVLEPEGLFIAKCLGYPSNNNASNVFNHISNKGFKLIHHSSGAVELYIFSKSERNVEVNRISEERSNYIIGDIVRIIECQLNE
jgi:hypothetical protein